MLLHRIGRMMDGVRTTERPHPACPCVQEPFNTASNLAFGVLGLLGSAAAAEAEHEPLALLYAWMAAACLCSSVHHASPLRVRRYTLVLDWLPIGVSIYLNLAYGTLRHLTVATAFKALLALVFLLNDLVDVVPVPWGHVAWHLLAALAVDAHYVEVLHSEAHPSRE